MMISYHRLLVCALALASSWVGSALAQDAPDDPKADTLVDCGADQAVLLANSESPDGNYAVGWTIRPGSNKKPVDWTGYRPEAVEDWISKYPSDDEHPNRGEYVQMDGIIDLRARKFTPLPSTFPYSPHKNHGNLGASWFDDGKGGRFALVNNDARFDTWNLWLVHVGTDGVHTADLAQAVNKAGEEFVRKQSPKKPAKDYALTYRANEAKQEARAIRLPFDAGVPKSEDAGYEGVITLALPGGGVSGITGKKSEN